MYRRTYGLYVSTFKQAEAALRAGDEQRLRALCAEVAGLGGLASTVSMMALSDAECGRPRRSKTSVVGMFWRKPHGEIGARSEFAGQVVAPAAQAA